MLLGAHVSAQGGLDTAPRRAAQFGCECFQMFTRSPKGGRAAPITAKKAAAFRAVCDEAGQKAWYIHTPYFINLASRSRRVRTVSIRIIRAELERGHRMGAAAVMAHLGSASDVTNSEALRRVTACVERILDGYRGETRFLLEMSAGSGPIIGGDFEELAHVIRAVRGGCGVCLDTQHLFAAGYDLRTPDGVGEAVDAFDAVVGLEHLELCHCNDSRAPVGSRKDRHEHIGKGEIGRDGFRAILGEPRLGHINFVTETRFEGVQQDLKILKEIRRNLKK